MAWDFETDPEFQEKLDWVDDVRARGGRAARPRRWTTPTTRATSGRCAIVRPLQQQVKERGLWACHLGPELGGQGYGQVKLALLNELLGRSRWAPSIFGCQAPDSGNAEILAHYGTAGAEGRVPPAAARRRRSRRATR